MRLPNDVARCSDALEMNCQWRFNCKRWMYRMPRDRKEVTKVVWVAFAKDHVGNEEGMCLHQIRID